MLQARVTSWRYVPPLLAAASGVLFWIEYQEALKNQPAAAPDSKTATNKRGNEKAIEVKQKNDTNPAYKMRLTQVLLPSCMFS